MDDRIRGRKIVLENMPTSTPRKAFAPGTDRHPVSASALVSGSAIGMDDGRALFLRLHHQRKPPVRSAMEEPSIKCSPR